MSWHNFGAGRESAGINRSSTRRVHPPGGASSLSLSGYGGDASNPTANAVNSRRRRVRDHMSSRARAGSSSHSPAKVAANMMMGDESRESRGRNSGRYGAGPSQIQLGACDNWDSNPNPNPNPNATSAYAAVPLTAASNGPPAGDWAPKEEAPMRYEDYYASHRLSTRVSAPPGGRSNFSLGGYPEAKSQRSVARGRVPYGESKQRASPSPYMSSYAASNSHVMASRPPHAASSAHSAVKFGADSQQVERSSTRRIAPPGGRSNFSLAHNAGGSALPPPRRGRRNVKPTYMTNEKPTYMANVNTKSTYATSNQRIGQRAACGGSAAAGNQAKAKHNAAGGSSLPWDRPMAKSSNAYANNNRQNSGNFITDRPSTKVHAAPGGRSTLSLGWN
eukprot:CAMPEP_0197525430 /NCGR_PEP_ID=MMETSP1318-20131121/11979_1 /TAXON_ID=552666 /ORGANISM="Partenskyella glossopodia, Strain RCC365" /LENGTH=390 /DNA_ID=CAMNT_0043078837 /DNA_START=101 /DNA_END=1273 /DNA_ORIENTATION=+